MAFETPSLDENHELLVAVLSNLLPGADISEGSFNWLWLRTLAAAPAGNDAHVDAAKDELLVDTAVDNLARLANLVPGGPLPRKTATVARKANALRVSGVAVTNVPGAMLTSTSGATFRIDGGDVVGPGGYVDLDIVAVTLGSTGRLSAGEVLAFTSSIAGLEDNATLVRDIDEGGDDLEDIEAWRARLIAALQQTPRGGTQADYVRWALAATDDATDAGQTLGIVAAYAYPLRNGKCTMDVVGLHAGTGDVRVLEDPERAQLQAYLDAKRPPSSGTRALVVTTTAVDVEYLIVESPLAQYAFDWDDRSPPTVNDWNDTTRVLTFDGGARPADIDAGDRLIFASGVSGAERRVEALGPSVDQVTLEADDAGDVPPVASLVYAGGPLVAPVRAAILALVNGLGTANLSKKYGDWEGSIRPKAIERVASNVPGATDDGECIDPAAVVDAEDPVFPDNHRIGLLVPGRVLAHRSNG